MSDSERQRAAMEREEARKQARWIELENDSELEYRMLAAMNIVERVYQLKRGRPETTFDGRSMNPGEVLAFQGYVEMIFKELCNDRWKTRRSDDDE